MVSVHIEKNKTKKKQYSKKKRYAETGDDFIGKQQI